MPAHVHPENDSERAALKRGTTYVGQEAGHAAIQATRPQTMGYGLADSPIGQAAGILQGFWAWSDFETHIAEIFNTELTSLTHLRS